MNNIFKDSKFGDMFLTKSGQKAVLVKTYFEPACEIFKYAELYVDTLSSGSKSYSGLIKYCVNGTVDGYGGELNIIEKIS